MYAAEDSVVKVGCAQDDYDLNNRINAKAKSSGILVLKCKVANKTGTPLLLTPVLDTSALDSLAAAEKKSYRAAGSDRIMDGRTVLQHLSFIELGYFLYAQPFGFAIQFGSGGGGSQAGIKDPISLVLGILLGVGNWHTAHKANRDFRRDVEHFSFDQPAKPNQTGHRLLHIKTTRPRLPITFRYRSDGGERSLVLKMGS